jgi:hypothetical protein
MEKKWDTVIPADLRRFFASETYTGCPRRKGQNFWRVFLMLKYTDITKKHLYPKLNGYGDNGQRSFKL